MAHSIKPKRKEYLIGRAEAYFRNQSYTETLDTLEQAYKLDSKDALILYKLGNGHYELKEYKRAIRSFK